MSELPRRLSQKTALSANWLNRLLDFLRSRDLRAGPGIRLTRTPSGTTVSLIPSSNETPDESPRLFTVKVASVHGRPTAFCYLPPLAAKAVRWRNVAVPPQDRYIGTDERPWVALPQASGDVWLVLSFRDGSHSNPYSDASAAPQRWELSFDGTATPTRWPHLIASVSESGLVEQCHLGSLLIGTPGKSETRIFVTATVVKEVDGVYAIVNERCRVLFVDGLAITIADLPDETIAYLGACT